MALIKCPECGKEVSNTCEKCIHCGYQLKKTYSSTGPSYSRPVHVESRASKIYERDQHIKWVSGIVAGVICIILAVILFVLAAVPAATGGIGILVATYVVCGIIFLITGIIAIIYYRYRINNY